MPGLSVIVLDFVLLAAHLSPGSDANLPTPEDFQFASATERPTPAGWKRTAVPTEFPTPRAAVDDDSGYSFSAAKPRDKAKRPAPAPVVAPAPRPSASADGGYSFDAVTPSPVHRPTSCPLHTRCPRAA